MAKFKVSSFSHSSTKFDVSIALAIPEIFQGGLKILMGHVAITTRLSRTVCHQ